MDKASGINHQSLKCITGFCWRMNLRLAIWESFVLWFFGSKIKDSYASEVVRQVLSARCNLLPVGFEMTDDDFGNEQAMMPNAAKSIEWPKPTLSELMTLLVWKDMKRHDMCFFMFFSCFLPDVGWLLATDFSKGWKTSEFAQKVALPFCFARKLRSVLKTEKHREARVFY